MLTYSDGMIKYILNLSMSTNEPEYRFVWYYITTVPRNNKYAYREFIIILTVNRLFGYTGSVRFQSEIYNDVFALSPECDATNASTICGRALSKMAHKKNCSGFLKHL